jgi:ABC-2 type transport system ATP-binding protein
MIAGYYTPTSGRVSICGHDVETDTIAAQANLGYLPEGAPAYGDMTPRQFLAFIAHARGFWGAEAKRRAEHAAAMTEIDPVMEQPIDTLSKGFKRRVGLAQAILHDPPALVMDEPTDGLDPNQKHSVRNLIRSMAADKAIIISTHLLEEVDAVCSRAVIIDRGRIVADGTPANLLARSRHHNAVTLTLPVDRVSAAKAALERLPDVAGVEEVSRTAGLATITVFPRGSALIIEHVSALAATENWDVKELYAEAGRLDDVFRALTTGDTQRVRMRVGAAA